MTRRRTQIWRKQEAKSCPAQTGREFPVIHYAILEAHNANIAALRCTLRACLEEFRLSLLRQSGRDG